jgi:hypothetical protein
VNQNPLALRIRSVIAVRPSRWFALAHEVMKVDAQTRGDRFPAWQKDLLDETLRAIDGIPEDKVFVDGYTEFLRDMVYGEKPDFATAIATLKCLAEQLRKLPK